MEDTIIFTGKIYQIINIQLVMENPFYFPLLKTPNTFALIKIKKL
jgi:hypothetical protein